MFRKNNKKYLHVIKEVYPDSIAEEMEIEPGDTLLEINNEKIEDVFDYRYLIKNEYIEVLLRKKDGEEWLLEIEKEEDDDLGMDFENGLMSEYRTCSNKCIFCFIDQMPPGMRDTLYFKDDDSRLSFLQGNYITMTNMKQEDIDRIVHMHLAPINISVQTTNPELRCKMLNNRFAGEKLKFLNVLYDNHIEMNGQVVVCKNVNDGEELEHTIDDLGRLLPFMRSVSAVPAGITKYRQGLFPLELFTKEEAGAVIDMIESRQQKFFEESGLHFIHASDEWYITAQRDFPEEERYDGYIQLENGVGMMRMFINEFQEELQNILDSKEYQKRKECVKRKLTIATGKLTFPTIRDFAEQLMDAFPQLSVHVYAIRNDFFGETITVSGLITGNDLLSQLRALQQTGEDLGETILIPSNMLRSGEQVFLDDLTVADVEKALHRKVTAVEAGGKEFIDAILHPEYRMDRRNENFVYIQAYDRD